jgi:excisionase family DNA binding protein
MSRYLTVEEVAEALRVSASWVYKHKNLLGGVRLGDRLWRFPEQDLMTRLSEWDVASEPVAQDRQALELPRFRGHGCYAAGAGEVCWRS